MQDYSKNFEGKNILITGGLGFIGSNLALKIYEFNPKKIVIVDSLVDGLGGSLDNINQLKYNDKVTIHFGPGWDIRDVKKMKPLIKDADIIFNLAGSVKHTKLDEKELEFDTNINFISQVLFLEACRQVMVENPNKKLSIVFAGTRDQYGKVQFKDLPVTENYLPRELTDYQSISKNAAEANHLIMNNVLREIGIDVKINSLRMTNTYGPGQSTKSGSVIPVFIEKATSGKVIELWGGGESIRDLNYVDDVIEALFIVASSEKQGQIYNLGCCVGRFGMENPIGENLLTIKNLAEKIVSLARRGEIVIIPYPLERKAIEPGHFAADISKIAELGWKPKTNLVDGLRKTIEWNLKNKFN